LLYDMEYKFDVPQWWGEWIEFTINTPTSSISGLINKWFSTSMRKIMLSFQHFFIVKLNVLRNVYVCTNWLWMSDVLVILAYMIT
jgi:hypothetical protein